MHKESFEEKREDLIEKIKRGIDSMPKEAEALVNDLIALGELQASVMDDLMKTLGLEDRTMHEAKEEIVKWKRTAIGDDACLERKKFYEKVEYVASQKNDRDEERNKLIMRNGMDGDLYLTVCPESHRGGITMRFERSGGCSTRNPKLLSALMNAYDAIAGNFNEENTRSENER